MSYAVAMELLLERIRALGELVPDALAINFVDERGRVVDSLSRADVVAAMDGGAAFLREGCGLAAGDRAVLVYPPGLDFARGLLGCLGAGVLAVPVYPPDPLNPGTSITTFGRIVADCGAEAVLAGAPFVGGGWDDTALSMAAAGGVAWPSGVSWYEVDGLGVGGGVVADWAPGRDTPALLQYTSGSTSNPKAVVITHGNLAHQADWVRQSLGIDSESRAVTWVPSYHDFGLISGILCALAGNYQLTMMSPFSFLQRPALWFEVMHRVRATATVSPNFGFELAVRKTTPKQREGWDLSSLTTVMSAAEPVREDTTRRFLEAFAVSGLRPEAFCPAYGLAEHSVGVTMRGRSSFRVDRAVLETQRLAVAGRGVDSAVLMGCGVPTADVDVRIVDPRSCMELGEDRVGEIWVDSPSKAAGYWGSAEVSAATFQAQLAGEEIRGRNYLRTGDLGFFHGGELFPCGRIKDLIIVAGRNIDPQDIEASVRGCHAAIRSGGVAAFSVDAGEVEAVAVLVEVASDGGDSVSEQVVAAVRAAVLKGHQLRCAVVAVGPPGCVSKTTSGKVQRSRCRARLLEGSLEAEALCVQRFDDNNFAEQVFSTGGDAVGTSGPEQLSAQVKIDTADRGFLTRLAGQGDAEQLAMVKELIWLCFGQIMGPLEDGRDGESSFDNSGLNSLSATEIMNLINAATGLKSSTIAMFVHPTPDLLARHILDELKASKECSSYSTSCDRDISALFSATDSFEALVRDARNAGVISEATDLFRVAARLRSALDSRRHAGAPPISTPMIFTRGPKAAQIVFICTTVFNSGVHNYARIAAEFRNGRTVAAIPLPGYRQGERVPNSADVAVESLARIVASVVKDDPFVLAGHSSGGHLAYALGRHFETVGARNLSGVALLDSLNMDSGEWIRNIERLTIDTIDNVYGNRGTPPRFQATLVTAATAWAEFLPSLYRGPLEKTDVLFIQCDKPWVVQDERGEYRHPSAEPWFPTQILRRVPVDHESIVSEGAQLTAQILEEWIAERRASRSDNR